MMHPSHPSAFSSVGRMEESRAPTASFGFSDREQTANNTMSEPQHGLSVTANRYLYPSYSPHSHIVHRPVAEYPYPMIQQSGNCICQTHTDRPCERTDGGSSIYSPLVHQPTSCSKNPMSNSCSQFVPGTSQLPIQLYAQCHVYQTLNRPQNGFVVSPHVHQSTFHNSGSEYNFLPQPTVETSKHSMWPCGRCNIKSENASVSYSNKPHFTVKQEPGDFVRSPCVHGSDRGNHLKCCRTQTVPSSSLLTPTFHHQSWGSENNFIRKPSRKVPHRKGFSLQNLINPFHDGIVNEDRKSTHLLKTEKQSYNRNTLRSQNSHLKSDLKFEPTFQLTMQQFFLSSMKRHAEKIQNDRILIQEEKRKTGMSYNYDINSSIGTDGFHHNNYNASSSVHDGHRDVSVELMCDNFMDLNNCSSNSDSLHPSEIQQFCRDTCSVEEQQESIDACPPKEKMAKAHTNGGHNFIKDSVEDEAKPTNHQNKDVDIIEIGKRPVGRPKKQVYQNMKRDTGHRGKKVQVIEKKNESAEVETKVSCKSRRNEILFDAAVATSKQDETIVREKTVKMPVRRNKKQVYKKLTCTICKKWFSNEHNLKIHMTSKYHEANSLLFTSTNTSGKV